MTTPFGAVLQETLKRNRLSQSRAAEQAGYDHSYVCRLCLGQRAPSREFIDFLVAGCGLDADEAGQLYGAAGFIDTDRMRDQRYSREDLALLEAARTLRDEEIPLPYREHLRLQITTATTVTRQMAVPR